MDGFIVMQLRVLMGGSEQLSCGRGRKPDAHHPAISRAFVSWGEVPASRACCVGPGWISASDEGRGGGGGLRQLWGRLVLKFSPPGPQDVAFSESGVTADTIRLGEVRLEWGPASRITRPPIQYKETGSHTGRSHVKTQAEIGVAWLRAEKSPRGGKRQGGPHKI